MKTWLVVLGLVLASSAVPAATSTPATIHIGNFTFSPAVIEIPAGTSLTWVNEDDAPHTVVGSDRDSPLKSPALDTDDHYAVVMSLPGTYHYFCSLHPHMTGTIVVK
jgi:plastocyanin